MHRRDEHLNNANQRYTLNLEKELLSRLTKNIIEMFLKQWSLLLHSSHQSNRRFMTTYFSKQQLECGRTIQYGRRKNILARFTPCHFTGSSFEFSTPPFAKKIDLSVPQRNTSSAVGLLGGSSHSCSLLKDARALRNR